MYGNRLLLNCANLIFIIYIYYILIVCHTFSPVSHRREYSSDSENRGTSGAEASPDELFTT